MSIAFLSHAKEEEKGDRFFISRKGSEEEEGDHSLEVSDIALFISRRGRREGSLFLTNRKANILNLQFKDNQVFSFGGYFRREQMTIQLQLKPEIEARLIAEAAAQGLSVEAYLASLIENSLTSQQEKSFYQVSTQEEWEATLTDLINSPAFSLTPVLSDTAISRESIYTREDEML